jgi:thioredoxin-related protein
MIRMVLSVVLFSMTVLVRGADERPADSTAPGIRFQDCLRWEEILSQAKKENKYIFVDCYTTWCGPCKKMEKEVYSIQHVGEVVNKKFISLKIQMDTTAKDNEGVKRRYADAHYFGMQFKLAGYPTLLFFNPDGKLLSMRLGAMDTDGFIQLTMDVLDPKKDYYQLLDKYRQGRRDPAEMRYLAQTALRLLEDTAVAGEIANSFITGLSRETLFIKENIELIAQFTGSSKESGFNLFFQYADTINRIMDDDNYAQRFVHSVIAKELVNPEFDSADKGNSTPDWNELYLSIKEKYGDYYAQRVLTGAHLNWTRKKKAWAEYATCFVEFVQKYGSKTQRIVPASGEDIMWNSYAWVIFQHSNKRAELLKALEWSNKAVRMNPIGAFIDTYANILYKLGYSDLALSWEELAVKQNPSDKEVQLVLEKMQKKQPTWPLE